MRKREIQIGQAYLVKVSGAIVPVRISSEHPAGGWVGQNLKTRREVRIRTAGRLRAPLAPKEARQ